MAFRRVLFFFQAEDGIRDLIVTGVQTCAFLFSSRRRHTRSDRDWSSDVCSSDLSDRTLVLKRHTPAIAHTDRLVAERWLPALGLGERCPRLLAAADRKSVV